MSACNDIAMKSDVLIRKATKKDLKEIQRLNHALFIKEYREYDKTLNTRFPFTRKSKNYFLSRANDSNQGCLFVAEMSNRIVGYLSGGMQKPKPSRLRARYAELETMIVDPAQRAKGIGSVLVLHFFSWCKKHKVNYVSVIASAKNLRGHTFYRRAGFKDYDLHLMKKM